MLSGCCFIHLKKGHLGRECHLSSKCRLCKVRNHLNICGNSSTSSGDHQTPPSQTANKTTVPTAQNTSTTTPALDPRAPSFTSPSTSTSLYVDFSKTALLQTAVAEVYNPTKPSSTLRIRTVEVSDDT